MIFCTVALTCRPSWPERGMGRDITGSGRPDLGHGGTVGSSGRLLFVTYSLLAPFVGKSLSPGGPRNPTMHLWNMEARVHYGFSTPIRFRCISYLKPPTFVSFQNFTLQNLRPLKDLWLIVIVCFQSQFTTKIYFSPVGSGDCHNVRRHG
jgi:hypothetical protein